ncbi:hypothetical protein KZ308_29195, partial [Escherichia coli]|nr:hypothetical protein [Escherichia coli]
DEIITQEQADELVKTVSSSVDEAAANSQVIQRAKEIKAQLKTAQQQIQQLADGSEQVAQGNKQLSAGLDTLADGTA